MDSAAAAQHRPNLYASTPSSGPLYSATREASLNKDWQAIHGDPSLAIYPDVKRFLDSFSVSAPKYDCDAILRKLAERGLFDTSNNRWSHLPQDPESEAVLYGPWTDIANAVSQAAPLRGDGMVLTWEFTAGNALSSCMDSVLVPDIIAILVPREQKQAGADLRLWRHWHRLILPGEFKKVDNKYHSAIYAALDYSQHMFREQADRRFVFAFSFSYRFLRVWYADRSCVLGSEEIDVHKNPREFIRFIVMMSTLPGDKLGFDPTMRAWRADGNHLPSYQMPESPTDLITMKWVVTMPWNGPGAKDDAKQSTVELVLSKTLSHTNTQVLRSGAVWTWLAWRLDEMNIEEEDRKVYALKEAWKQVQHATEGELYAELGLCSNLAVMYGHEVVSIDGKPDTTVVNQKGLNYESLQTIALHKYSNPAMQRRNAESFEGDIGVNAVTQAGIPGWFWRDIVADEYPVKVLHRKRTRICLSAGLPIIYFKDLYELCRALSGVIMGLHSLSIKGFIYRNLALSNVLIDLSKNPTEGMIIDLNRATKRGAYTFRRRTTPFMAAEQINPDVSMKQYLEIDKRQEEEEALLAANPDIYFTPEGLASLERPKIRDDTSHSYIHDMESVLWLLCFICIYYSGPGTPRDWSREPHWVRDPVWSRFESGGDFCSSMAETRRSALASDYLLQRGYTNFFTPFFKPLIALARVWREVLAEAYLDRDKENTIHQAFLDCIAKMEQALPHHLDRRPATYELSEEQRDLLDDERRGRAPRSTLPESSGAQAKVDV